jgi:hypothetical protein
MKELLHSGLISIAERSCTEGTDMFDQYVSSCKAQIELQPDIKSDWTMSEFQDMPLLHGIINRMRQIIDSLERITKEGDWSLIDAMNSMRMESVDRIVSLKRDPAITVRGLRTL